MSWFWWSQTMTGWDHVCRPSQSHFSPEWGWNLRYLPQDLVMDCIILKENEPLDLLAWYRYIFPVCAFMNPVHGFLQMMHNRSLANVAFSYLLPKVEKHASSVPHSLCFNKSVQGNAWNSEGLLGDGHISMISKGPSPRSSVKILAARMWALG